MISDPSTDSDQETKFTLPMWPSDAMWMKFINKASFPFAIKVEYRGRCGVTGGVYCESLVQGVSRIRSETVDLQNFVVSPVQLSLDGICHKDDVIEQFAIDRVAVEKDHRLKLTVYPMKKDIYQEVLRVEGFHPNRETEGHRWTTSYQDFDVDPGSVKEGVGHIYQTIASTDRHVDVWDWELGQTVMIDLVPMHQWVRDGKRVAPHQAYTKAIYDRLRYPWFDWYEPIQWTDNKEKPIADGDYKKDDSLDELPDDDPIDANSGSVSIKEKEAVPGWWKPDPTKPIEKPIRSNVEKTLKEPSPVVNVALGNDYRFELTTQVTHFDESYGQTMGTIPSLHNRRSKEMPKPVKRIGFWERLFAKKE
ncbi:MAG: hypothetical protein J6V64_06715 [Burkholderiaceae bacterium]|nr:hypothetical protein [Burkholderiaceae bacterium]